MADRRPRQARVARGVLVFVVAFAVLLLMDGSRQPTSGGGWRLLAMQRSLGQIGAAEAISDAGQLAAKYEFLHLGTPPPIDFATSAIFVFTGVGSIGCPARFEGISVDATSSIVTGLIARRLMFDCDPSRVPDAFVVAIDRSALPSGLVQPTVGSPS